MALPWLSVTMVTDFINPLQSKEKPRLSPRTMDDSSIRTGCCTLRMMADVTPAADIRMSHLLTAGCYHPALQAWASPCQDQSFSAPPRVTWRFLSIARQLQPPACTATAPVTQLGVTSVCAYMSIPSRAGLCSSIYQWPSWLEGPPP